MLELGLKILLSYLLGSVNGSLLVGRLSGGIDIRQLGSGNPGGTNALRTQGKWFALRVMLIDVGKGFLPPWLLPALALPGVGLDAEISRSALALACAGAAIFGHCYPVWHGFAGGKGAATTVGALGALMPVLILPGLATFALVLVTTGFVGLATMTGAAALPVYLLAFHGGQPRELLAFLGVLTAFIVFTHRSNIRRMLAGRENRWERLMLLRRSG